MLCCTDFPYNKIKRNVLSGNKTDGMTDTAPLESFFYGPDDVVAPRVTSETRLIRHGSPMVIRARSEVK